MAKRQTTKSTSKRAKTTSRKAAEEKVQRVQRRSPQAGGTDETGYDPFSPVTPPLRRKTTTTIAPLSAQRAATAKSTATETAPPKKNRRAPSAKTRQKEIERQEQEVASTDRYVWLSLILLFIAGYLAIASISYLIYWDVDQNVAYWSNLFTDIHQDAQNWGGRLGAVIGQNIIGRWFGVFGLLLPLTLFFIAVRLLRLKSLKLRRATRATLMLMIIGSITAGHLFGTNPNVLGSGWGGMHGIFIAEWLEALLGGLGTSLLLITLFLSVLYYAIHRSIRKWIRKIKEYIYGRQERRRMRNQMHQIKRQERMIEMRAAMEERRLQMLERQQRQEAAMQQPATEQTRPEPESGETEIPQPEQDSSTEDTATHTAESDKQEEPTDSITPTSVPQVDYSRLIQNPDGSWGYFMGYDEWNNPVTYNFDYPAYWYELYYNPDGTLKEQPQPATIEEEPEEPELTVSSKTPEVTKTERVITAPAENPEGESDGKAFIVEQPEEEQLDNTVIDNENLYDPTAELSRYRKPRVELLDDHTRKVVVTDEELLENKNRILTTLENFGIKIDTIEATIGPTVTLYEIVPAPGVRISKIKNLEDDIALSLSALGIRIIAPIPGRGTIGIEVPNKDKEIVSMYSVIKSPKFHQSSYDLPVALGKTISNETFVFDLAKMPHLLVAGATGQGKSVGLNAIITSLLYKKHPAELKFVLVDPKKVELTLYSKLEKHFLAKMPDSEEAIITDTQKVIYTLNSLCIEMDARYDLLKAAQVRNIKEYNEKFVNRRLNPEKGHRYLPYFVVIVDEFADLIMTAGREIETPIARLAQLARAIGIHLIIATQRPTTNIITGVIKANFPARIAFRVTSMIDSRTILDQPGANQLIGRGDMLISTGNEVTRVQCAFIDTPEVDKITDHISQQQGYTGPYELPEYTPESEDTIRSGRDDLAKRDPLFEEVARYVVNNQVGSASTIQRNFSIGFNRAGRIVDQLEAAGIVGPNEGGGRPRKVVISDAVSLDMVLSGLPQ